MVISESEKRVTAIHEAGHALLTVVLPNADPIHKVTIIPRGRALGLTQQLPMVEKHLYPREFLANDLAIYMGGRAAEEMVLGHMTTGAGNDIERATDLARKMVCEFGMSEKMGPLTFGKRNEQIFLGREFAQHKDYSEQTAIEIDAEVRRIVMENYTRAKTLLRENLAALHGMATALLEKESLDGPDIDRIIAENRGGAGPGEPAPAGLPPAEPLPA
jgi:cell division protease FtsH